MVGQVPDQVRRRGASAKVPAVRAEAPKRLEVCNVADEDPMADGVADETADQRQTPDKRKPTT